MGAKVAKNTKSTNLCFEAPADAFDLFQHFSILVVSLEFLKGPSTAVKIQLLEQDWLSNTISNSWI